MEVIWFDDVHRVFLGGLAHQGKGFETLAIGEQRLLYRRIAVVRGGELRRFFLGVDTTHGEDIIEFEPRTRDLLAGFPVVVQTQIEHVCKEISLEARPLLLSAGKGLRVSPKPILFVEIANPHS